MELLHLIVGGLLASWLGAIAAIDLKTFRIPNVLSITLAATGLVVAAWNSDLRMASHVAGAAAGYLALAGVGEAFFRLRGTEGLGLGDAKLFGASGAWLGWQALPYVLLLASVSGLVHALALRRRTSGDLRLAFGPHLAASFWLIWVFGAPGLSPAWR